MTNTPPEEFMFWHTKQSDINTLQRLLTALQQFQNLKYEKWEHLEEEVQMNNYPGSPSEDWIIPPDSDQTIQLLQKDPEYRRLRNEIAHLIDRTKDLPEFLEINTHHTLDWINFNDPLIGNSALEDGIASIKQMIHSCQNSNYFVRNLYHIFARN